jgi:hypothetical protein
MLGVFGIAFTAFGGALAPLAARLRAHQEALETFAGFALIGGLGLIGAALPHLG